MQQHLVDAGADHSALASNLALSAEELDHALDRVADLRAELRSASPVSVGAPSEVPCDQPDLSISV